MEQQWLVLGVYERGPQCRDAFSDIKHNNFLPYVMAALEPKNNNGTMPCSTTPAGYATAPSPTYSSLKNGTISTVALTEGCIAGVMRKNVTRPLAEKGSR